MLIDPMDYFLLNSKTGQLHTARPLDRESLPDATGIIVLTVRVRIPINHDSLSLWPTISCFCVCFSGSWTGRWSAGQWQYHHCYNTSFNYHSWCKWLSTRFQQEKLLYFARGKYTDRNAAANWNECPWPGCGKLCSHFPISSFFCNFHFTFPVPTLQGQNSVFALRLEDVSGVFDVEPKLVTGSSPVSIRIANGTLDYENPNQRKFIVLVSVHFSASTWRARR